MLPGKLWKVTLSEGEKTETWHFRQREKALLWFNLLGAGGATIGIECLRVRHNHTIECLDDAPITL